jgi:hypothetical protein
MGDMGTAELLSSQGHYLQAGVVQISLANLLIIIFMVVLFVLALVVPFPGSNEKSSDVQDVKR